MGAGIDAVAGRMGDLLAELTAAGDPGRFFLGTYLRTTRAIGEALAAGVFADPAWVEEWDVDFAERYLDALAAHRRAPASAPRPWQLALGARPELPPEAHVLLGMNAHINYDLPQSLVAAVGPAGFADPRVRALRRHDHGRVDRVLAERVAAEDGELQRAGGRRTRLDRAAAPVNRAAVRVFLRESRRTVWANAERLEAARRHGAAGFADRLDELEAAAAARVADLLRPGPVLLRLAVRGFGVRLPR